MNDKDIKFRGKRVDNKEWVYGDLLHNSCNKWGNIFPVGIKKDGCHPVEVRPESVGQWTGLKYKNNIDIYEGRYIRTLFGDRKQKT